MVGSRRQSHAGFPLDWQRVFFNDTATTEIYTLSLHDALPIWKTDDPLPIRRPGWPVERHGLVPVDLAGRSTVRRTDRERPDLAPVLRPFADPREPLSVARKEIGRAHV